MDLILLQSAVKSFQVVLVWHSFPVTLLFFLGDYSARPKSENGLIANGEASNSKKKSTSIEDVLKGLVEWLCAEVCTHL